MIRSTSRVVFLLLCVSSIALAQRVETPVVSSEAEAMAALSSRIETQEQRLRALKDLEAIENLISVYGYYLDKALWDQVADLFAEDGEIEISRRGVYKGKARIRACLDLFTAQGLTTGNLRNHIQVQPVIHIADDGLHAWSRHRAISQLGSYDGAAFQSGGLYENEYVNEDGVWKIKRDQVYTIFFTTYADGLFEGLGPAAAVSPDLPPDAPPSVDYAALPEVFIPAFHYRHPVTGRPIRSAASGPATTVP
jgi:hypothetical protein